MHVDQSTPPAGRAQGRVIASIVVRLASLPPRDRLVAEKILEQPEKVIYATVSELADSAGVAPSTVVHACKALGYRGYQDLKIALAQDVARADHPSMTPAIGDNPTRHEILTSVLLHSAQALAAAPGTIDPDNFDRAVTLLRDAKQTLLLAFGGSRAPADDAAYRLSGIGLHTSAPADVFAQHRTARLLTPADVCIAISYTGSTRETIEGVEIALEQCASVIAITSHAKSPLTELATTSLIAGAPERNFRLQAMTSRLAQLAIIDALYTALAVELGHQATEALDAAAEIMARHIY